MFEQHQSCSNLRRLKNMAKQLHKHWLAGDPAAVQELRLLHPSFEHLPVEQLEKKMCLHNAQLALARKCCCQNWQELCARVAVMKSVDLCSLTPEQVSALLASPGSGVSANREKIAAMQAEKLARYERGRPRREDGGIVISEKLGLTLKEAMNDRAKIHSMPPVGTRYTNAHGIEWRVEGYDFFVSSTTFARYPGDCDYLPVVNPQNPSKRLQSFISEVDRCTTRWVLFLDTMPDAHPFGLGRNIHCAHMSADPTEAHIFLDVKNAHETTIAHELAHLWTWFVKGMVGERVLRDRKNHAMKNQLDFIQSFVLDIEANNIIEERGFDMSLIAQDQYHGLTALRDLMMTGFIPPTRREPLIYCLQIAGAVLEQQRWPSDLHDQLVAMLEFFEAATPEIYATAMEFVDMVRRQPLDTRAALRTALDECIVLGFRFTGDNLDLERDFDLAASPECMQDKYPQEFVGMPVPLKLEICRAKARHRIEGEGTVSVCSSTSGMAMVTFIGDDGSSFGPIQVNYRMAPAGWLVDQERERIAREKRRLSAGKSPVDPQAPYRHIPMMERPRIKGMIPDDYGRLPGDSGYNTSYTLGQDPLSLMAAANARVYGGVPVQGHLGGPWQANARGSNQYGLANGDPNNLMPFPSGHPVVQQPNNPVSSNHSGAAPGASPVFPWADMSRNYMAGLTRSITEARLAQQDGVSTTNLYQYAENNPAMLTDPTGLDPVGWDPNRPGEPNLPCKSMRPKANCYYCAYDYYFALGLYATACQLANRACGSHVRCDRDPVPNPIAPPRKQCQPGFGGGIIPEPGGELRGLVGGCANLFCKDTYAVGGSLLPLCIRLAKLFTDRSCQLLLEECQSMTSEVLKDICDGMFAECCVFPVK